MTSSVPPASARITPRAQAKAERRREILGAAARLMARRGFHSVRLDDIGGEVGISGPAMYRYFSAKEDVLAEMLLDISRRLHDGGAQALAGGGTPGDSTPGDSTPDDVLDALIAVQVDFVVHEPDLISVQFRDLGSLPEEPRHEVRRLQREYVQMWVDTLRRVRPDLDEPVAAAHVHAAFGLLNSSPRLPDIEPDRLGELLGTMARATLYA